MAVLFVGTPGQAIMLNSSSTSAGLPLAIAGRWGSWYTDLQSIVSEASLGMEGNYQYQPTFSDIGYVYAFGDRPGLFTIGGIAFASTCDATGATGVDKVLDFYNTNRIAAQSQPLQLQLGTTSAGQFRGGLIKLSLGTIDAESQLCQFGLTFLTYPGANP